VVLIIHGLTTSSDMFIMPEHCNLVQYLLDHGFTDVWTLDFRMSNRFQYNLHRHRYNLDDIALFDFPPALAKIRAAVGSGRRIHVICHCLGSVSFMMSLFGKAVDGIASVISNSVALTPRVKPWSRLKLTFGPFFLDYLTSIPSQSLLEARTGIRAWQVVGLVRVVVSPRMRLAGVPHAQFHVGHGVSRGLSARESSRHHASPRRRSLRRDEHALLPPRAKNGRRWQHGREVRARKL
jgi:predicted alpha/beta hydrolase